MNERWPKVRLGEVLRRSEEITQLVPDVEYREITVRLWGKGVIERRRVLGAEISGDRRFAARSAQFIVSRIDARNGAMGLVPPELDGAIVSNDFPLFDLDKTKIQPEFLGWLCQAREFVELCQRASEGTTNRVRLQEGRFLALEIPLPPLAEQQRIVAKIQQLAAKIAEARTLRQNAAGETEALLNANISQVFRSLAPFRKLVESNSCRIHCGQHLSPEEQSESGIPYITGPADFGPRVAAPSRFARASRTLSHPGDVLLTVKGAGVGKVNFAPPFPAAIGRQLYALRPSVEKLDQAFLWYALQFGLQHFRDAITATTVPGIGRSDVEGLEIPIPPLLDQRWIVAELDALYVQVDALKRLQAETTAELDALLPSILDKGFKGEL